jgi:hypothetical protein
MSASNNRLLREFGEGLASLVAHALLVMGGIELAGVTVSKSAIVTVAGLAAVTAFLRFTYFGQPGRRGYIVGVVAAGMIYPALYTIIDNAETSMASIGLVVGFLASFTAREVAIPVTAMLVSVAIGAALGLAIRGHIVLSRPADPMPR